MRTDFPQVRQIEKAVDAASADAQTNGPKSCPSAFAAASARSPLSRIVLVFRTPQRFESHALRLGEKSSRALHHPL
jgi:hypothetical protein